MTLFLFLVGFPPNIVIGLIFEERYAGQVT